MENQAFKSSTEGDLSENGEIPHCPDLPYKDGVDLDSVRVSAVPLVDGIRRCHTNVNGKGPSVPPRKKSKEQGPENRNHSREERHSVYTSCQMSSLPEATGFVIENLQLTNNQPTRKHSKGVQAWPTPPYRLKVVPRSMGAWKNCRQAINIIGKLAFCQIGLASLLLVWAVVGALAFRYTEGPREENAGRDLAVKQKYLISTLASELREVPSNEETWYKIIEKYMNRHEVVLASMGTETPGQVWSFPGCVLFAVSLLTTLGFGAPVPKTSGGRAVAIVFAAIGIPLHLLLVLNIGMVIAVKLQRLANRPRKSNSDPEKEVKISDNDSEFSVVSTSIFKTKHRRTGSEPIGKQALSNISREARYFHITESNDKIKQIEDGKIDTACTADVKSETVIKISKEVGSEPPKIPAWLKYLPFVMIAVYYTTGVLLFGVGRYQSFLDSLMFPLDFTVAGGVASTPGYVRILYAIYLEGAMILAAATVSILQVSATEGLTDLGLKFGLLTNSR